MSGGSDRRDLTARRLFGFVFGPQKGTMKEVGVHDAVALNERKKANNNATPSGFGFVFGVQFCTHVTASRLGFRILSVSNP